jgi:hypothetical protein
MRPKATTIEVLTVWAINVVNRIGAAINWSNENTRAKATTIKSARTSANLLTELTKSANYVRTKQIYQANLVL